MASTDTFVVYKGDEIIAIGSSAEVAEALGTSVANVEWMASPTAKRRAGRNRLVAERVRASEVEPGEGTARR